MLSSTLTVQPLATIRAPSSSSAKRSSSFRGAKIPAAPMKVRFFLCVCVLRARLWRDENDDDDDDDVGGRYNLRGRLPFSMGGGWSFWIRKIFWYISLFFASSIFFCRRRRPRAKERKRERERERERRQTGGASALRFTLLRFLERVDHHHSFIHSSSCPNFDYLVPPARTQQKTKYFSFFIFFSFAAFQSVDDGTRLKSYFHSNTLQNY